MAQTRTVCPRFVYLRLRFETQPPAPAVADAAQLERLIAAVTLQTFGSAAAPALRVDVVDFDAAASTAVVRTDAASRQDVWTALTLLSRAGHGAARIIVQSTSAHLLALAD